MKILRHYDNKSKIKPVIFLDIQGQKNIGKCRNKQKYKIHRNAEITIKNKLHPFMKNVAEELRRGGGAEKEQELREEDELRKGAKKRSSEEEPRG